MTTVLDDGVFPIVGWAGPGGDLIRPDVMQGMAEAVQTDDWSTE